MKRSPGLRAEFDLDTVKLLMGIFDTDRSGTIGFNEVRFNPSKPSPGLLRFLRSSLDCGNTSRNGKESSDTSTRIVPVLSTARSFKPPSHSLDIIYPLSSSNSSRGSTVMHSSFQWACSARFDEQSLTVSSSGEDMFKASPTNPPPGPSGFGGRPPPAAQVPGITFDRFVRACVVIKQLSEAFQKIDTDRVRFFKRSDSNPGSQLTISFLPRRMQDGWIQINYDQFMHTVLSAP